MTSPAELQDTVGSDGVLFASFNQDFTSLTVGTNAGFTICDITSVREFRTIYDSGGTIKDVHIFDRLFSSSLIAIVSMTTPRLLKVCHFKKGTEICTKLYLNQVLAVRINRQRVIVVLEDSLNIHNMKDMNVLHTIRDTPLNPKGICALSTYNDTSFLAYPGSTVTGDVQIFDVTNLKAVVSISAHNGPLATLAFDQSGTKLATASVKGTVIRVFSIPDGQPLFDLRRGLKRCAEISCLAFSVDSSYLCVSSNTETVHIFKLADASEKDTAAADDGGSWMGYFNKVVSASVSYLPTQVSSVLNQERAFATAKLPVLGVKNICAIVTIQKVQYVVVACYNGYVYVYILDTTNGSECEMLRQHYIIPGVQVKGNQSSGDDSLSEINAEEASPSTKGSQPVFFRSTVDERLDTDTG